MGMGGGGGGKTTTTQSTTPWGPQQQYLTDIFARAGNLANQYEQNPTQQSPLFDQYIQQAVNQSQAGIPGQDMVVNRWGQALNATTPGTAYANAIAQSSSDPGIFQRINDTIQSGYTPNAANPYLDEVKQDTARWSDLATNRGWGLGNEIASNTGVAQNLQNQYGALTDMWKQAYGNNAIPALAQMSGSQWAQPYSQALVGGGAASAANPYMQQIANIAGSANPYIGGTADAASLAMSNPALAQLMETAGGKYLTPDTNPFLQKAVQAAQEQTMANIAGQFNKAGRYGSGMMAGVQAKELGNIANQAYSNAYESERARQEAARQALGGQYLQGVGQLTSGQQAAAGLTQGQQGLGLQGLGAAGQMYGTGMGQMLGALQGAGSLAGQQQQLGQQAMAESGQQYGTAVGQDLAAKQAAAQAAQNQVANAQNSYGQLLQAQNQRAQNQQGIAGLYAGMSQADLNRQLQAQQSGTEAFLQNMGLRTQGQQSAADTYLKSLGLQTNALGFAPTMQGMQQGNLAQLANAAQIQQQMMQAPQDEAWNNLANYLAMVQGSYGGTGKSSTPYYSNPAGSAAGGALGGAMMGGAMGGPYGAAAGGGLGLLAGLFSARSLKNNFQPIEVARIAEKVRDLPIERWSYIGLPGEHIGPYAEDFQDAFGVGDGVVIPLVDAIGVLFVSVQHLLRKNEDLLARVEELENAI